MRRSRESSVRSRREAVDTHELGSQIDAFPFRIQVGDLVALPLKSAPSAASAAASDTRRTP